MDEIGAEHAEQEIKEAIAKIIQLEIKDQDSDTVVLFATTPNVNALIKDAAMGDVVRCANPLAAVAVRVAQINHRIEAIVGWEHRGEGKTTPTFNPQSFHGWVEQKPSRLSAVLACLSALFGD